MIKTYIQRSTLRIARSMKRAIDDPTSDFKPAFTLREIVVESLSHAVQMVDQ